MLANANLLIGAYCDGRLVGLARALTDFSYCCYLSDLAVAKEYQRHGIGRELVARVKRAVRSAENRGHLPAYSPDGAVDPGDRPTPRW